MRICLFGDGAWAANSLAALIDSGHTVTGVVLRVQPTSPVLEQAATRYQIPVFQPERVNAAAFLSMLATLGADLGLSIAYNQIFNIAAYSAVSLPLVNFHAGKLPCYRGRNVINWALVNGEKEVGLTSHFVDDGIDTGRILLQRTLPISWTDGYGDVLARVVSVFPAFVIDTVRLVAKGEKGYPQNGEGTYFPGRGRDDEWLDWNDTSFHLHNKIRAITRPGPGARTWLADGEIRIWRAFYDPSWPSYIAKPGAVVGRSADGVYVKTCDSVIRIEEVESETNGPERPHWPPGTRLGLDLVCMLTTLENRFKAIENRFRNSGQ